MKKSMLIMLSLLPFTASADILLCRSVDSGQTIQAVIMDLEEKTAEVHETSATFGGVMSEVEKRGAGIQANIEIEHPSGGYSKQNYTIFNYDKGMDHSIVGGALIENEDGKYNVAEYKKSGKMKCERLTQG